MNEHIDQGDQEFQIAIDPDVLQLDFNCESKASDSDSDSEAGDEGSNEDTAQQDKIVLMVLLQSLVNTLISCRKLLLQIFSMKEMLFSI